MTAPEPLTVEEVRALREVAEGATPGPWEEFGVISEDGTERWNSVGVERDWELEIARLPWSPNGSCDTAHIAAFDPPTVLRLLATAEQHAAMVARVGARVGALESDWITLSADTADWQRRALAAEAEHAAMVARVEAVLDEAFTMDDHYGNEIGPLLFADELRAALGTAEVER
jgi:hypothetical protein